MPRDAGLTASVAPARIRSGRGDAAGGRGGPGGDRGSHSRGLDVDEGRHRHRPLPAADVQKVLSDWGLVPDGYLLFMGTIEPRKNLLRLLQAA